MRHNTRRIRNVGTAGILIWTALVVMPPLALAGAAEPWRYTPQARTSTPSVSKDMVAACQTHPRTTSSDMDALRARIQAAQAANDPVQMRAILDEVLQQQTAMQDHMRQDHMAMCTNMTGTR